MNMKNEEKAKEIGKKYARQYHHNTFEGGLKDNEFVFSYDECVKSALEMAKWADQTMINKACEYIYSYAHVTTFGDIRLEKCSITEFIDGFRKAMEE